MESQTGSRDLDKGEEGKRDDCTMGKTPELHFKKEYESLLSSTGSHI